MCDGEETREEKRPFYQMFRVCEKCGIMFGFAGKMMAIDDAPKLCPQCRELEKEEQLELEFSE